MSTWCWSLSISRMLWSLIDKLPATERQIDVLSMQQWSLIRIGTLNVLQQLFDANVRLDVLSIRSQNVEQFGWQFIGMNRILTVLNVSGIRFLVIMMAVMVTVIGILIFRRRWIVETGTGILGIGMRMLMVIGDVLVVILIIEFVVVVFVLFRDGMSE